MTKRNVVLIVFLFIIIGVACRLLVHIPNITPITAIALFISAYAGFRYSIPTLLAIMLISDAFIGFYDWHVMLAVYGSFILAGLLGMKLQKARTVRSVFGVVVSSSLVFFIVTNWAVWQFGSMYVHTFSGLMNCYFMAIPFFKYSLLGDFFYTGFFFGIFGYAHYFSAKNTLVEYSSRV